MPQGVDAHRFFNVIFIKKQHRITFANAYRAGLTQMFTHLATFRP